MRVITHDLLDHTTGGGALAGLCLGEDVISRRESHIAPFLDLFPQG
jgi:hypothetical protein